MLAINYLIFLARKNMYDVLNIRLSCNINKLLVIKQKFKTNNVKLNS